MILGRFWMKKHVVLLDMIYNFITFFLGFYTYLVTFLSPILSKLIKEIKKISKAKRQQDITLNRILKKDSIEKLDGFLKTTKKIVKKKERLANAFKQKSKQNRCNADF